MKETFELPGLKGFSEENIKLMRRFYEAWKEIEVKSVVRTTENTKFNNQPPSPNSVVGTTELQTPDSEKDAIHGMHLTNDDSFPIYIQIAYQQRLKADELESVIKAHVYNHRDALPNNFFKAIPDKALALKTLQMFKDSYLLDYINVEMQNRLRELLPPEEEMKKLL